MAQLIVVDGPDGSALFERYANERRWQFGLGVGLSRLYHGPEQLVVWCSTESDLGFCRMRLTGPREAEEAAAARAALPYLDRAALAGLIARAAGESPVRAGAIAIRTLAEGTFEAEHFRAVEAALLHADGDVRAGMLAELAEQGAPGWPPLVERLSAMSRADGDPAVRAQAARVWRRAVRGDASFCEQARADQDRDATGNLRLPSVVLEHAVRALVCGWPLPQPDLANLDLSDAAQSFGLRDSIAVAALNVIYGRPQDGLTPAPFPLSEARFRVQREMDLVNGLAWSLFRDDDDGAAEHEQALLGMRVENAGPALLTTEVLACRGDRASGWSATPDFRGHVAAVYTGAGSRLCRGAWILCLEVLARQHGTSARALLDRALVELDDAIYGPDDSPQRAPEIRHAWHIVDQRRGRRTLRHLEVCTPLDGFAGPVPWTLVIQPIARWLGWDLERAAYNALMNVQRDAAVKPENVTRTVRKLLQSPDSELRIVLETADAALRAGPGVRERLVPRLRRLEIVARMLRRHGSIAKTNRAGTGPRCDVVVLLATPAGREELARYRA